MERLIEVARGSDDIVVGISGFGSADTGPDRWVDLANLTGRTTMVLMYDAQEFPWPSTMDVFPPPIDMVDQIRERWRKARSGAIVAADYLATWLERWTQAGRRVLVVGFSLGAYVAWNAIRQVPSKNIELIMIAGAIGDTASTWEKASEVGRIVNLFSSKDYALKAIYPYEVGDDETPAAGLGPLVISDLQNVYNVDITDLVGSDHLWASDNVRMLYRIGVSCYWDAGIGVQCEVNRSELFGELPLEVQARLYRWLLVDSELWGVMNLAVSGDVAAVELCISLDEWSLEGERLPALLDAGMAAAVLMGSMKDGDSWVSSSRALQQLRGMLRKWLQERFLRQLPVHDSPLLSSSVGPVG